jgi:hypothetical protein
VALALKQAAALHIGDSFCRQMSRRVEGASFMAWRMMVKNHPRLSRQQVADWFKDPVKARVVADQMLLLTTGSAPSDPQTAPAKEPVGATEAPSIVNSPAATTGPQNG